MFPQVSLPLLLWSFPEDEGFLRGPRDPAGFIANDPLGDELKTFPPLMVCGSPPWTPYRFSFIRRVGETGPMWVWVVSCSLKLPPFLSQIESLGVFSVCCFCLFVLLFPPCWFMGTAGPKFLPFWVSPDLWCFSPPFCSVSLPPTIPFFRFSWLRYAKLPFWDFSAFET